MDCVITSNCTVPPELPVLAIWFAYIVDLIEDARNLEGAVVVIQYVRRGFCEKCRSEQVDHFDSIDERVLVVRGEDEVCTRRYLLRCCIKQGINIPGRPCFLEVIFNKGSRTERRVESQEMQPDSPSWNFLIEAPGVALYNLPSIEVKIMESSHLVPVHMGSAFLHIDDILEGVPIQLDLPVQLTPIFRATDSPMISVAYQLCLPHSHFDSRDSSVAFGLVSAVALLSTMVGATVGNFLSLQEGQAGVAAMMFFDIIILLPYLVGTCLAQVCYLPETLPESKRQAMQWRAAAPGLGLSILARNQLFVQLSTLVPWCGLSITHRVVGDVGSLGLALWAGALYMLCFALITQQWQVYILNAVLLGPQALAFPAISAIKSALTTGKSIAECIGPILFGFLFEAFSRPFEGDSGDSGHSQFASRSLIPILIAFLLCIPLLCLSAIIPQKLANFEQQLVDRTGQAALSAWLEGPPAFSGGGAVRPRFWHLSVKGTMNQFHLGGQERLFDVTEAFVHTPVASWDNLPLRMDADGAELLPWMGDARICCFVEQ
eukprot:s1132_g8.t1